MKVVQKQQGFTLLELMIAMVLSSAILVTLFAAVRLGGRAWESGHAKADETDQLRLVQQAIRRSLTQAKIVQRFDQGDRVPSLLGEAAQVTFVAFLFVDLGRTGLFEVNIRRQSDQLVMSWWPFRPENLRRDPPADAERTALLDEVTAIRWQYYGLQRSEFATDFEEVPEWHDRWEDRNSLPELVRLDITWRDESWPTLVVSVHN